MSLPSLHQARSGCVTRPARSTRKAFVCSAVNGGQQQCVTYATAAAPAASRRETLLQASLLGSWLAAGPALASNGFKAALCSDQDTAEEAGACRAAELAKDQTGDYSKVSVGAKKALAPNVPVSDLNNEYVQSTRDLAAKIDKYLTLDVYDKSRQPLIKSLKTEGSTWVSKYARGGSARSQSARNMYIAVDAVQGYLASNGLAPMPKSKARVVEETMSKALAFLSEGK